jgi:uncharacterized repeat protein (TIGR04138 family)
MYTQKQQEKLRARRAIAQQEGEHHVSGRQLLEGIRELALHQFGFLARTVFRLWNIHKTADFGEIVFNLIEANHMSRRPEDRREDFHDVFDLNEALAAGFHIELED